MAIRRLFICVLAILTVTGCGLFGAIYSNTTVPYSTHFIETPVGTKQCIINDYQLKEPFTRVTLSAEWTRERIINEAKKAGIKEIYYMDVKTISILLGIYRQREYIVYGD